MKNHTLLYYSLRMNLQYFHIQSHNRQFEKHMGSILHHQAYYLYLKISNCGEKFYHWVFWTLTGIFDLRLTEALDFSLFLEIFFLWWFTSLAIYVSPSQSLMKLRIHTYLAYLYWCEIASLGLFQSWMFLLRPDFHFIYNYY